MWLKLPGPHFHPLTEQPGGQVYVLPQCRGSEWMPGIYYTDATGEPRKLLSFTCPEHAAESLSNLFIMWAHCKNALYLVPNGVYWILDPALKEKPKE